MPFVYKNAVNLVEREVCSHKKLLLLLLFTRLSSLYLSRCNGGHSKRIWCTNPGPLYTNPCNPLCGSSIKKVWRSLMVALHWMVPFDFEMMKSGPPRHILSFLIRHHHLKYYHNISSHKRYSSSIFFLKEFGPLKWSYRRSILGDAGRPQWTHSGVPIAILNGAPFDGYISCG